MKRISKIDLFLILFVVFLIIWCVFIFYNVFIKTNAKLEHNNDYPFIQKLKSKKAHNNQ